MLAPGSRDEFHLGLTPELRQLLSDAAAADEESDASKDRDESDARDDDDVAMDPKVERALLGLIHAAFASDRMEPACGSAEIEGEGAGIVFESDDPKADLAEFLRSVGADNIIRMLEKVKSVMGGRCINYNFGNKPPVTLSIS
eukprot:gene39654-34609_t